MKLSNAVFTWLQKRNVSEKGAGEEHVGQILLHRKSRAMSHVSSKHQTNRTECKLHIERVGCGTMNTPTVNTNTHTWCSVMGGKEDACPYTLTGGIAGSANTSFPKQTCLFLINMLPEAWGCCKTPWGQI